MDHSHISCVQKKRTRFSLYAHSFTGRDLLDYPLKFKYSILRLDHSRLSFTMRFFQQIMKLQL